MNMGRVIGGSDLVSLLDGKLFTSRRNFCVVDSDAGHRSYGCEQLKEKSLDKAQQKLANYSPGDVEMLSIFYSIQSISGEQKKSFVR
jgi:hypothetical protein